MRTASLGAAVAAQPVFERMGWTYGNNTTPPSVEDIAQWAEEVACDEAASPAEVRWQES